MTIVSRGSTIVKPNARKVRLIGDGKVSSVHSIAVVLTHSQVIAGFAGSTSDALTLLERLESRLEEYPGQLLRASVEMAKSWRTDKYLRALGPRIRTFYSFANVLICAAFLEALLIVADKDISLTLTGTGDVLEPHDGVIGIGSGGDFALAAARALITVDGLSAMDVAQRSMKIAADLCVYTNDKFIVEQFQSDK